MASLICFRFRKCGRRVESKGRWEARRGQGWPWGEAGRGAFPISTFILGATASHRSVLNRWRVDQIGYGREKELRETREEGGRPGGRPCEGFVRGKTMAWARAVEESGQIQSHLTIFFDLFLILFSPVESTYGDTSSLRHFLSTWAAPVTACPVLRSRL